MCDSDVNVWLRQCCAYAWRNETLLLNTASTVPCLRMSMWMCDSDVNEWLRQCRAYACRNETLLLDTASTVPCLHMSTWMSEFAEKMWFRQFRACACRDENCYNDIVNKILLLQITSIGYPITRHLSNFRSVGVPLEHANQWSVSRCCYYQISLRVHTGRKQI